MHGFATVRAAAWLIRAGGVVAYPTEGVYGLGCRPDDPVAVARILDLKGRHASTGMILIAADFEQLDDWIEPDAREARRLAAPGRVPVTWIVSAGPLAPDWITGGRPTVAVRIVGHPLAAELCRLVRMPIVSTSANRHGRRPARTAVAVRRWFPRGIDLVTGGAVGHATGPSEIRSAATGEVLRRGAAMPG
jgi:L-threonylcarbamoyladenylate synthase